MLREGREYAGWHKHVVVKLPTTREGIKGCKTLSGEGIKINMTLCFSPNQALLIAKAGASYCSPFVGRLDDISENGMQLIRDIKTIYTNYNYKTEILAASLRHPLHVVEAALAGAHVGNSSVEGARHDVQPSLTDRGLATFLADAAKVKKAEPELWDRAKSVARSGPDFFPWSVPALPR